MSCSHCLAYKAPVMLAIVEVRMDFHCRVSFARVSKIVVERKRKRAVCLLHQGYLRVYARIKIMRQVENPP